MSDHPFNEVVESAKQKMEEGHEVYQKIHLRELWQSFNYRSS